MTDKELGEVQIHTYESGVAYFCYSSEEDCLKVVRQLLTYIYKRVKYIKTNNKNKLLFKRFRQSNTAVIENKSG